MCFQIISYKIEDCGEVGHELFEVQYFMSALCGIRVLLLRRQNHCVLTASDFCYYWGYYDYAISAHYLGCPFIIISCLAFFDARKMRKKYNENLMKLTQIKIIHGTHKSRPEANSLHLERLLSRISIILKSSSKFRTKLKMIPKGSSWEGFDWRLMITQQQSICKWDSRWISSKLAASGYESKLTFQLIFNHFE